jgi:hypothetical protein
VLWNSAGGPGIESVGQHQAADGRVSEPLLPHIVRSPPGTKQALDHMKKQLAELLATAYKLLSNQFASHTNMKEKTDKKCTGVFKTKY